MQPPPAHDLAPDLPLPPLKPPYLLDGPRVSESPQRYSSVISLEGTHVMLTSPACGLEDLGAMSRLRMGLVVPGYTDLESGERLKLIH